MDELHHTLEPLIRRVVREELTEFANQNPTFFLDPSMPLYEDMQEIWQRKMQDKIELFSYEEVWDE
jgi:abortive infection bacteriophage resistance protein